MKNPIIRYGIFSGLTLLGMFLLSFYLGPKDFGKQEILGYVSIFVSLIFVFLGIRQFREEVNGGIISFGKALKVGLLIALIPSVVFGLFNLFYVEVLDPQFMDNYYQTMLAEMKANMPAAEFEAKAAEMEAQKEMFMNPVVQFFAMGLTVFLIGIVVAIVSAFFLKKDI